MGETSWLFLIIGSVAALGAAMAFGTLAALWRYHRTGLAPGSDEPVQMSRGKAVSLWLRVGVGVVVAVYGIIWIDRTGIL